jgi:DNA (cytosine-5)-methyltransferase 1
MLKALSICSGIGGLDIAMQSEFIGATTYAYCEIEPYACAVLLARMESGHLDAAPIFPDIFKLDAETLEAANIESVDIVYGGIPCQPFSQAGLRRADDDPRNLWPATRKLLGILGRPAFFVENVAGFTIRNGSEPAYAWTLLDDLAEDGYDFRWVHVRAEDVGAPHRRERFFLLAYTPDSIAKKRIALRTGVCAKHSGTGNELGNSERRSRSSESGEFQPSTVHDGRVFRTQDGQGRADHRMAFPPRPDELERWRDILALYPQLRPSLERSVRGVADGIQDGVDFHRRRRLQALGNAVVPQQAIYAWLLLTSDDWVQS